LQIFNPFEFLSYSFGIKAFVGSILTGILCSIMGTFIVLKKFPFIGAGLAHIAFAGVAFGILLGKSPLLFAFLFTLLSSLTLWYLNIKKKVHYDITIGILFAASMGLAVLFLSLSGNYGSEALSYLFGSPLFVNSKELIFLGTLTAVVGGFFLYFWKEIYLILFSTEIAKASGYKVEFITFWLFSLLSLTITFSIESVGALLVFSLLVVPAATAQKVSKSYRQFFILSILFGTLAAALGILISFTFNAPPGATVTLVSTVIYGIGLLF